MIAHAGTTVRRGAVFVSDSTTATTMDRAPAEVFAFSPRDWVTLTRPTFSDWISTAKLLERFCNELQPGWDGYRGQPTRFDVANFAYALLRSISRSSTPQPSLIPLSSGGLQIEWHTDQAEIEMTIRAPLDVDVWVAEPDRMDEGIVTHLSTDYTFIVPWVQRLG